MENLCGSKCVCKNMDLQLNSQKISKNLWRLAYPTMISAGLQNFYDIVDMVWVGQISKTALSGVTLFSSIYMLFTILNEIAGASSVSMIAQNYGRGDMEKTQRIAEQTISFKVVLAVISGLLLAIFLKPLLWFFLPDQEVVNSALEYGWLRIFFIPVMFSSYSVNTIFRCTGDAKTPLHIMIIATIINLVLDPLFMFDIVPGTSIPGLGLGVFGAALATVIARSISFLYGILILLSGKRKIKISFEGLFRLDKKIDTDLLLIGLPSGINSLVRTFAQVTIMKFVTVYGADAVAIAGVGGKLAQFAFMPIFGFSMGGATLVGQSLGRDNVREAKLTSKITALMSASIVGIFAIIIMGTPQTFLHLFFPGDIEMLNQGSVMLRIFYPSFIILSAGLGFASVFSGSGHTRPMLYSTLGSRWFVQIPFLFLIVNVLHLPLYMVWTSYILSELAEFTVILYHYRKGVWCNKRV
ncbi:MULTISPECIES: MATE family efflux transporter [unclassified Treponema]|uniref:MATE family efflux transporter n=1 Tax=unclassified Treponema TaxID=2638727 RepID=UPI0020A47563|nr:MULTISPECIES: MATE family efflux transporter [unclassified Treponema]UTC66677.1 MATE family efflux transporter [Treponema sp. OMZ 789]UTC69409.1 MATE family efflux transporter [Treponema sp. OMZ 790]UTC72123.1 MATE family efflux transporter [Treponema sp. OMZ 791]